MADYRKIILNATAINRFWSKVRKTEGCWLWIAARDRAGYGIFAPNGRPNLPVRAHQVAWMLAFGEDKMHANHVLHRCDNPACIRPSHLFLGTDLENLRDMCAKGRHWHQGIAECPRGHPYSGENLYVDPCGRRKCRICTAQSRKRYEERQCQNITRETLLK